MKRPSALRFAVIACVMLAGLFGVMRRVKMMPMRYVRVVARLLMLTLFVVIGSRAMVLCGMLVVFSSFTVMLGL